MDDKHSILPALAVQKRPRRRSMAPIYLLISVSIFFLLCHAFPVPDWTFYPFELAAPSRPALRFKNGKFQISIFSDLHYGENAWDSWGPQQDINSQIVMNKILDSEKQDFVVLNGDLITGDNAFKANASVYLDTIVKPLVRRQIPWASTYGNHDSSFNLSRSDILAREQAYSLAYTKQMVSGSNAGVSNYYLPIYPSNATSRTPALILWFFDSRGGFYYQEKDTQGEMIGQADWVDSSVVNWFQETNANLTRRYGQIPSLAFVHIPTNASAALQANPGPDKNKQPGINDDNPLAPQAQGWCPNGVNDGTCSYGGQDTMFMQAIASTPGLMALFSGHDHGDTWCYKWSGLVPGMTVSGTGVSLCFNEHSGYGGYGDWARGAREVLITEVKVKNHVVDTWIRLETGDVVGNVSLNSTYGTDVYPASPNIKTSCPTCNYTIVSPMPGTKTVATPKQKSLFQKMEQIVLQKTGAGNGEDEQSATDWD